jgi:hypothetical protein
MVEKINESLDFIQQLILLVHHKARRTYSTPSRIIGGEVVIASMTRAIRSSVVGHHSVIFYWFLTPSSNDFALTDQFTKDLR